MIYSNCCNTLFVFLTILKIHSIFSIFFLLLSPLLMLLPYFFRWAPLIIFSYLYFALFLQTLLRIIQSRDTCFAFFFASWRSEKVFSLEWLLFPCQRLSSLCAERITKVIVSGMETYIPHYFSKPKSSKPWSKLFFTLAVFVLYVIKWVPSKGTWVFHHMNLVRFTFLPWIMPNLLFKLPSLM